MTRSALVPTACPFDFPDVDKHGWTLIAVQGPPRYPMWSAVYVDQRRLPSVCVFCEKEVRRERIGDDEQPDDAMSAVFVPYDGQLMPAHGRCARERSTSRTTAMATYKTTAHLPACRECGQAYEDHDRPVTTIWEAYCVVDGAHVLRDGVPQCWRPGEPFVSRNWPHATFIDSPRYTTNFLADESVAT